MSHDPTDILAVLDAEERDRALREAVQVGFADDLVAVMGEPSGRRFVWALLEITGNNARSFDPSNTDPYLTAWREGRRDIGREIQQRLFEHCPGRYDEMLRERAADLRRLKESAA